MASRLLPSRGLAGSAALATALSLIATLAHPADPLAIDRDGTVKLGATGDALIIDPDGTVRIRGAALVVGKDGSVSIAGTRLVLEKGATLQIGGTSLSIDETGKVAIGGSKPIASLDIGQADRVQTHPASVPGLYVTGKIGEESNGIEFRHSNGTQGIGFGYNTVYATGGIPNQDLKLKPRGTGKVQIKGDLHVDGMITGGQPMLAGSYYLMWRGHRSNAREFIISTYDMEANDCKAGGVGECEATSDRAHFKGKCKTGFTASLVSHNICFSRDKARLLDQGYCELYYCYSQ